MSSYASAQPTLGTAELCFWQARWGVPTSALTDYLLNPPRWMKGTRVSPLVFSCCTELVEAGASHLQGGSQTPTQGRGADRSLHFWPCSGFQVQRCRCSWADGTWQLLGGNWTVRPGLTGTSDKTANGTPSYYPSPSSLGPSDCCTCIISLV